MGSGAAVVVAFGSVTCEARSLWSDDICATMSDGSVVVKTRTDSDMPGGEVSICSINPGRSADDSRFRMMDESVEETTGVVLLVARTDEVAIPVAEDAADSIVLGLRSSDLIMSAAY